LTSPQRIDSVDADRSITFFFPYHDVSGVPVLFLTMARFLADELGKKVTVVDYADGYIARNLRPTDHIEVIPFKHGAPCVLAGNTLVVMQSILPSRAYPELSIDPGVPVLYWHLFPANLFHVVVPILGLRQLPLSRPRVYRLLMKWFHSELHRGIIEFVRTLNERRGIVYYDRSTIDVTRDVLGIEIADPVLVPVPIEVPPTPMKQTAPMPQVLRVAWIGRLADFKMEILLHTIRRFSRMAAQSRITVEYQVIGDGSEAGRLDKLSVDHPHFALRRMGVVAGEELKNHLLDQADLVTAMGQSALESARFGVPTILLDFTFSPIRRLYRFRWLYETIDGDLAHLITDADLEASDTLPAMIDALFADYASYVVSAHDYCRAKHDIATVGRAFHAAAAATRMTMAHVPDVVAHRGIARRVYDRLKYGWQS